MKFYVWLHGHIKWFWIYFGTYRSRKFFCCAFLKIIGTDRLLMHGIAWNFVCKVLIIWKSIGINCAYIALKKVVLNCFFIISDMIHISRNCIKFNIRNIYHRKVNWSNFGAHKEGVLICRIYNSLQNKCQIQKFALDKIFSNLSLQWCTIIWHCKSLPLLKIMKRLTVLLKCEL